MIITLKKITVMKELTAKKELTISSFSNVAMGACEFSVHVNANNTKLMCNFW